MQNVRLDMVLFRFICIVLLTSTPLVESISQEYILDDPGLLRTIKKGVNHIYNYEFDKAMKIYNHISKHRPEHPVKYFYYGLSVYWEQYPLTPKSERADEFVDAMYNTMNASKPLLDKDNKDTEGVFFDLVSRSMLMMYYADNEESAKTIKYAPSAYKQVLKSFELKELFNEYYFITGLYNYYIEAYPEKHPVYKPLTFFFQGGDKQLGLKQLKYASEKTTFIRVEASLFLALIYYNFENKPDSAVHYIEKLHKTFPDNPYFLSKYVEYLILDKQYDEGHHYLQKMVKQHKKNNYIVMKGIIFKGIIEEIENQNYNKAKKDYKLGLKIARYYDPRSSEYISYAYYGLARIAKYEGEQELSKSYHKKARAISKYDHFSNF